MELPIQKPLAGVLADCCCVARFVPMNKEDKSWAKKEAKNFSSQSAANVLF
jgi:hypothetical protein